METVKSCADSLLSVINDILDFSKIEAGKLSLENVPFNLADAIDETCKTFGIRAAQKGLELICNVRSTVPDTVVGRSVTIASNSYESPQQRHQIHAAR